MLAPPASLGQAAASISKCEILIVWCIEAPWSRPQHLLVAGAVMAFGVCKQPVLSSCTGLRLVKIISLND